LAALAQARLVLGGPSASVRAQLAVDEFRVSVELAPDHADTLTGDLPDEPTAHLLRARLAVRRRDWSASTQILDRVNPVSIREQVEWGVLSSLTHQERDRDRARKDLAIALTLAHRHMYLATIIRAAPGVTDLLRSMPSPGPLQGYVDGLLRAADRSRLAPPPEARARADTFLTGRERDVLRLLASRLTSQEIAETLFISPNTLKSHVKNVYVKLHVNSRADAVSAADARQLL
jgi:LuxR family maltose regulon positive regulatory protein